MTYQIVQVRYSAGSLVEDTWPVLYDIPGQAIADFSHTRMFEHGDEEDADYFLRELDRDYVATGKTITLSY